MWSIRRRERKPSPLAEAAARFISARITILQAMVVRRLQTWERKCSLPQKKVLFVLFCSISILVLLSILAGAFTAKAPLTNKVHVLPVGGTGPSAQPPLLLPPKDSTEVRR